MTAPPPNSTSTSATLTQDWSSSTSATLTQDWYYVTLQGVALLFPGFGSLGAADRIEVLGPTIGSVAEDAQTRMAGVADAAAGAT